MVWTHQNEKPPSPVEEGMRVVFCQQWEESERGWGVRPDGYSLHLTLADAQEHRIQFLEHQKEWFTNNGVDGVPDEYTRPCGDPYRVKVTEELYLKLEKDKNMRFNDNAYPDRAGWTQ